MANQNPRQQDTPTTDSDAKFHDAKELLQDTEKLEGTSTRLENTQVTTIAPMCHHTESADAETLECSPTIELCTQGTDVTDLTDKQPGKETHVQSRFHSVQTGSSGLAKWLSGERKRKEAADPDRDHGEKSKQTKRTKASKDYHKRSTVSWDNRIGNWPGPCW